MNLISLGLVTEHNNHQFYVEISDYDRSLESSFVKETVVPLLQPEYAVDYPTAGHLLLSWLESFNTSELNVVVDYAGDIHLMAKLIEKHSHTIKISYEFFNAHLFDVIVSSESSIPSLFHKTNKKYQVALTAGIDAKELYFQLPGCTIHHALTDAIGLQQSWLAAISTLTSL